jgi:hypothetical protein
MLTEAQSQTAWKGQLAAEVRSLYFADLTSWYALQKQVITFSTFFLSSGAVVTLIGKFDPWVAIMFSVLVALMAAYSMALGIDRKVATMSGLHGIGPLWRSSMRAFRTILMQMPRYSAASGGAVWKRRRP